MFRSKLGRYVFYGTSLIDSAPHELFCRLLTFSGTTHAPPTDEPRPGQTISLACVNLSALAPTNRTRACRGCGDSFTVPPSSVLCLASTSTFLSPSTGILVRLRDPGQLLSARPSPSAHKGRAWNYIGASTAPTSSLILIRDERPGSRLVIVRRGFIVREQRVRSIEEGRDTWRCPDPLLREALCAP